MKALEIWFKEYIFEIACFLLGFVVARTSLDIGHANGLTIPTITGIFLEVAVGCLFAIVSRYFDKKDRSLNDIRSRFVELFGEMKTVIATYDERFRNAVASHRVAEHYLKIADWNYSPEVKEYITKTLRQRGNLLDLANELGQKFADNIALRDEWYLVLDNFLSDERSTVSNCSFTFSLETYLSMYIAFMDVYKARAQRNGKRLIIYSFTNAIPGDWFVGGEAGNIMSEFMLQKVQRIESMKKLNYRMQMVTLSTNNNYLDQFGFRDYATIRRDWLNTSDQDRLTYINKLHTDTESALLAKINIKNLELYQNLTEFIFFGFLEPDVNETPDVIEWQFCLAGGFSSKNKYLLARCDMLAPHLDSVNVISVENLSNYRVRSTLRPPERIVVPLLELPKFILDAAFNGGSVEIMKYKHIMTLADKWNLAAEIWHTQAEANEIKEFLAQLIKGKNKVLDCACGSGFHTRLLLDLGKTVTASDSSAEELSVLKKESWATHVSIRQADWRELSGSFQKGEFDAIICLGTSIPYYKSWDIVELDGDVSGLTFHSEDLRKIISQLAAVLAADGILVLGLSRHNERSRTAVKVEFKNDLRGRIFKMIWNFDFDWVDMKRTWQSEIRTPDGDVIRFSIVGHLFDHDELRAICGSEFEKVEVVDIDPRRLHYDKYIVCEKKKHP